MNPGVIILLVVLGIGAILYFTTDFFKSEEDTKPKNDKGPSGEPESESESESESEDDEYTPTTTLIVHGVITYTQGVEYTCPQAGQSVYCGPENTGMWDPVTKTCPSGSDRVGCSSI